MWNRTSDPRIQRSDGLSLSHRDSTASLAVTGSICDTLPVYRLEQQFRERHVR